MTANLIHTVPENYLAVPFPGQGSSPLKLCLIVSAHDKPERLVPLSAGAFTRSYLGCLVDAQQRLVQWLVIEFQSDPTAPSPCIADRLNNQSLDEIWEISCDGAHAVYPYFIATQWEKSHPPPLALNTQTGTLEYFSIDGLDRLELCTDTAQLAKAGLPNYASDHVRHLMGHRSDGQLDFIPAEPVADTSAQSITELMLAGNLLPINPGCHFIRCRTAAPMDIASLADVLGGAPWGGIKVGKEIIDPGTLTQILADRFTDETSTSLFLGRHGRWGRAVEGLHLKIKMLADMASAIRRLLSTTHRPMLNLSLSSFAAQVSSPSVGLPFLWTVEVGLIDGGIAVPIQLGQGTSELFTPAVRLPSSIFQPQRNGQISASGVAEFRLRSVEMDGTDRAIVDGTIGKAQVDIKPESVVSIRLAISGRELLLHGSVSAGTGPLEWRFRGAPGTAGKETAELLTSSAGVVFSEVWLDAWENYDAAYDMYALAVCFCRVLFGGSANTLPAIVDDLHALAHLMASQKANQGTDLLMLVTENERFKKSFGIENVFLDTQLREAAAEMIPMEIWRKILTLLLRMLPGVMPDAFVRRYGAIKGRGQATAFDAMGEAWVRLLVQTRSLILIDWRMNREIHAAIRRVATGI